MEQLRTAGIACGALNETEDLVQHPQLRTIKYGTSAGEVSLIAPPVEFSDGERHYRSVPGIGQHNSAIRAELEEELINE